LFQQKNFINASTKRYSLDGLVNNAVNDRLCEC